MRCRRRRAVPSTTLPREVVRPAVRRRGTVLARHGRLVREFRDAVVIVVGGAAVVVPAGRRVGGAEACGAGGVAAPDGVRWRGEGAGEAAAGADGAAVAAGAVVVGVMLMVVENARVRVRVVAVALVDLGRAEPHWDAGPRQVRGGVGGRLDGGVVPDLGADAAGEAERGAGAGGQVGGVVAADDLHGGAHLGGALLGQDARVFLLGAVAPDRRLLLAHQRDVARRRVAAAAGPAGAGAAEALRGRLARAGAAGGCGGGGGGEGSAGGVGVVVHVGSVGL